MEEDPVKLYKTKSECMANASVKFSEVITSFQNYGYANRNCKF